MVNWGVPEKILQNVVQTRWTYQYLINRTLQSKFMTKSIFGRFSHRNYNVKLQMGGAEKFIGL